MLVMFVSASQGKVDRKSVAQILDMYAHRTGPDQWMAHVTERSLHTIRMHLKTHTTRKASVLCRKVSGFSKKKAVIQWIIGNPARFTHSGDFSVHHSVKAFSKSGAGTKRISGKPLSLYRMIWDWSRMAGQCHDLGKNHLAFQDKLRGNSKVSDTVRHEILSTRLMWEPVTDSGDLLRSAYLHFQDKFRDRLDVQWGKPETILSWVVASHHRLPGKGFSLRGTSGHVRDPKPGEIPYCTIDDLPFPRAASLPFPDKIAFPAFAFYVRLALMLGDHYVSAMDPSREPPSGFFARRVWQILNDRQYIAYTAKANRRQVLRNHLDAVGFAAGWIARFVFREGLSKGLPTLAAGEGYTHVGRSGRFAWQGQAVDTVLSDTADGPRLALVMASTGSGKTLGCLALADALCARRGKDLRATVALGLRTLTLQTGAAYREKLDLQADDLSVVLGSQEVRELHESSLRDEEGAGEHTYTTDAQDFWASQTDRLPSWVASEFTGRKAKDDPGFLLSPLLVCTIDQIMEAADLRKSGWIKPLLRLASGPLILDEIDNYDLSDLVPILRLIYLAGLLGQDVVVSTATLYPALAESVFLAHQSGWQARKALFQESGEHRAGIFYDGDAGSFWLGGDFQKSYGDFCANRFCNLDRRRLTEFLPVYPDPDAAFADLGNRVVSLHRAHARATPYGNRLSVGMIRFAHVREVMRAARHLAESLFEDVRIVLVPYHSRNTLLSRSFIEYRLDGMLYRGKNPDQPLSDPDVQRCLQEARISGKDLCVVVVCSPVEEVGRDHDFDWGIIEPSSTRSIVQTAGRILRHRHQSVPQFPNVFLYHKPVRALANGYSRSVYVKPGYEIRDALLDNRWQFERYHYDTELLLGVEDNSRYMHINPSWCVHPELPFPSIENQAIANFLDTAFRKVWLGDSMAMMQSGHFDDYRFRSKEEGKVSGFVFLNGNDLVVCDGKDGKILDCVCVEPMLDKDSLLFSERFLADVLRFWEGKLELKEDKIWYKKWLNLELYLNGKSGKAECAHVDPLYGVYYNPNE